tara:strand:- start:4602 stop:6452 length:1851 start_codon:yes stop_codon:yes gene_type:complete
MITTSTDSNGRIIVSDDAVTNDTPQEFTVCVKNESDWTEIHNYIINENEIDNIPNRKISCTSDMNFSPKRSVYSMSVNEANILRNHSKVEWVEQSSMYNPVVLEQRKYDEEFDRHTNIDRFKINCRNMRPDRLFGTNPGSTLDFTQWGVYRHQSTTNNFGTSTIVNADSQYSLTGKNVDIVIMDTGVRWDHPEFLKSGVSSFSTKADTRVRDILIHGAEEYGINWTAQGLTAPGSGSLSNYTVANVLESSTFGGSWHGSHVAGTAAGNQFSVAFEANIWTIACVDRSDVGWSEPSDGFDYIKVWHKNKPINPETGLRNPTVVNCSWGHRQFFRHDLSYNVTFRGSSYTNTQVDADPTNVPAVYYLKANGLYYREFTTKRTTGQTEADELVNDSDCQNVVLVCAMGNSEGKNEVKNGIDYDNEFTSGTFYYGSLPNGYDPYYTRSGTPAITREGEEDAAIKVGSLDSNRQSGSQERNSGFSNKGPNLDIWAAGTMVLSPLNSGYSDPRDNSYYIEYLNGTSMATPNVSGVIALHLESTPTATRKNVREWLLSEGSRTLSSSDYYDPYTSNGANDTNYWGDEQSLKSSPRRVLYNPYANNTIPKIEGVVLSGVSITQT